jgi:hypothetical protein
MTVTEADSEHGVAMECPVWMIYLPDPSSREPILDGRGVRYAEPILTPAGMTAGTDLRPDAALPQSSG